MNFGGIGLVVGHELTHGFDDEGRQFDAEGNLRDWWTPAVSAEFDRRAECVVKQFDDYIAVDEVHVKGKLTLGENIADLGGLKLSYATFQRTEKEHPATPPLGGFSPEQQFFLGFAQAWCTNPARGLPRRWPTSIRTRPPATGSTFVSSLEAFHALRLPDGPQVGAERPLPGLTPGHPTAHGGGSGTTRTGQGACSMTRSAT